MLFDFGWLLDTATAVLSGASFLGITLSALVGLVDH